MYKDDALLPSVSNKDLRYERAGLVLMNSPDGFYTVDDAWRLTSMNRTLLGWLHCKYEDVMGAVLWDVFPEYKATVEWDMLHQAAFERKLVHWEVFVKKTKRWADVSAYPVSGGELAVCIKEVSKQKQDEQKLHEQDAIMQAIKRVYQQAMEGGSIEMLGAKCLAILEEETQSKIGLIGEMGGDGLLHDLAISDSGWEECGMSDKAGHNQSPGKLRVQGLCAEVLQSKKSLLTNNPSSHPASVGVPEGHPALVSFLGVPFIHSDQVVGMIAVANRQGGYTRREQTVAEALAPIILEVLLRTRAQESLRIKERLYVSVFEGMDDHIYVKDRHSRMLLANGKIGVDLGIPISKIIGKTELEYYADSEQAKRILENDRRIMDLDLPEAIEETVSSNGEARVYLSKKVPWHDERGDVIGLFGISREITEQKRYEAEVRQKNIVLTMINRIYEHSVQFDSCQELSKACIEIIKEVTNSEQGFIGEIKGGDPSDETLISGGHYLDQGLMAVHPNGNSKGGGLEELLDRVIKGGKSVVSNEPISHLNVHGVADKSVIIKNFIGVPFIRSNEVVGFVGAVNKPEGYSEEDRRLLEEITPTILEVLLHKKAEQAERESDRKYQDLVRCAPAGISEVDFCQMRFLSVNDIVCEVTGYSRDELLRMSPLDIMADKSKTVFLQRADQWLSGVMPQMCVEYGIVAKDGHELDAMMNVSFTVDRYGKPVGGTVIGYDITERKQMERTLRESEQRALELVSKLEEVDKSKNEFINVLSHELRNPLAAIDAWLQLSEISGTAMDTLNAQGIIRRQVDQLIRLVEDLLEISRIVNNKITLRKESLNLGQVAMKVVDDHIAQFNQKGVALSFVLPHTPTMVLADPARVTQIIGNLLHNALKYTAEGGEVTVSIQADADNAAISVKDNGIGLEKELLPVVFEPFMQGNQSMDRTNGGLGIGLSIVKGIAELHNGSVSAESQGIGKGSTFTIQLPIEKNESERKRERVIAKASRSFRVLIIEDNRDLVRAISTLLQIKGHTVKAALNGLDGINLAIEYNPEIVLCDIGLPGFDGYEVARRIRGFLPNKGVFLIALSGYGSTQDLEQAKKSGFNEYLIKPVSMQTLIDVFDKAEAEFPNPNEQ